MFVSPVYARVAAGDFVTGGGVELPENQNTVA